MRIINFVIIFPAQNKFPTSTIKDSNISVNKHENPSAQPLPVSDNDILTHTQEIPVQPPIPLFIPNPINYVPNMIPLPVLNSNSNSMCDENATNKDIEVVTDEQTENLSTADPYRMGPDDDSDEGNEKSR